MIAKAIRRTAVGALAGLGLLHFVWATHEVQSIKGDVEDAEVALKDKLKAPAANLACGVGLLGLACATRPAADRHGLSRLLRRLGGLGLVAVGVVESEAISKAMHHEGQSRTFHDLYKDLHRPLHVILGLSMLIRSRKKSRRKEKA